jgi:hypothetical protein
VGLSRHSEADIIIIIVVIVIIINIAHPDQSLESLA